METGNNNPEKRRWFYKPPTSDEIEQYGFFIAKARAGVVAERKSSRVFSLSAAIATGGLITMARLIESGSVSAWQILPNFVTPLAVNGIAQLRTERVQRRNLNRLGVIAKAVKGEAALLGTIQTNLEQHVQALRSVIEEAGLDIPEVPGPPPTDESS